MSEITIRKAIPAGMSSILDLDDLIEHLKNISQALPPEQQIPNYLSVEEILCQPEVIIENKDLQFRFKIPIVSKMRSILYKLIPIPIVHGDKMYWIEANTNHVAIGKSNSTLKFYLINIEDSCDIIGNAYICKRRNKLTDDAEQLRCIISLYNNNSLPNDCVIHTTNAADIWIPITENTWAFVIPNSTMINSGQVISGTGLLTYDNVGIFVDNNSIIISEESKSTTLFSPILNLTELVHERPHIQSGQFNHDVKTRIHHMEEKIEEIKHQDDSFNIHDIHHYTGPYCIIFIIIIIIAIRNKRAQTVVIDHSRFFSKK